MRKLGEKVVIDGNIVVTIVSVRGGKVRLGIEAPVETTIFRSEVATRKRKSQCLDEAEGASDECFAASRTGHAEKTDDSCLAEARTTPSSRRQKNGTGVEPGPDSATCYQDDNLSPTDAVLDKGPEIGQSEENRYKNEQSPQVLSEESPTAPNNSTADPLSKVESVLGSMPEPARQAVLLDALFKSTPVDAPFDAITNYLQSLNHAFRQRLIARLEPALNDHLNAIMPTDNPRLTDPVERRKDLVNQKERVMASLKALPSLGLAVRCVEKDQPDLACPGYLMLTFGAKIPRGEFRLTRRGGVTVDASANLANLLPLRLVEANAGQEGLDAERDHASDGPKSRKR